ncbi:hypothetical protein [Algiphilus sp.]|uniref:hypothetical protein n=1 Tax=Algiphilus sp. TaxID=1872431 RepID=UPI003C3D850A
MRLRTGTIGMRSALAFFALLCHLLLPVAHAQLMASQSDGPLSALICGTGSEAFADRLATLLPPELVPADGQAAEGTGYICPACGGCSGPSAPPFARPPLGLAGAIAAVPPVVAGNDARPARPAGLPGARAPPV